MQHAWAHYGQVLQTSWVSTWIQAQRKVSYAQSNAAEVRSSTYVQCPIFKTQCEQLLALFNTGASLGGSHHAASVSASGGVFGLISGASGVVSTSSQPLANTNFIETMSGIIPNLSFTPSLKHSIFFAKNS